jgi:glycosyltransferase involved in cell wall biosynthesis
MRVLFLCYRGNPYCGGQGIYLYHLTRELSKLGVEIDILVGPPYPLDMKWARVQQLEGLNLFMMKTRKLPYEKLVKILRPWNFIDYILTRLHIFPEMETFSVKAFFSLGKALRERQYDLIHDVQCLGWGLLPMKAYGIPIITTVHHPLSIDRNADLVVDKTLWDKVTTVLFYPLSMQRYVIKRMERVITSSVVGVGELVRAFDVKEEKVTVIYEGIDVEVFRNTGEEREERSILFVGNTEDHKKGLLYLFEALALLPDDIKLTIVDEGPPKRLTAPALIRKMGLENRVTFTGKVDQKELVHLYSTKTVLVMSSLYEGFGLPAAEAMACETPVVSTTAGALKEVVGNDGAGILVPARDSQALRDALLSVFEDKDLQRKMGKIGRKRAEENFSWPVAAKKVFEVYEDVIGTQERTI